MYGSFSTLQDENMHRIQLSDLAKIGQINITKACDFCLSNFNHEPSSTKFQNLMVNGIEK